MLLTFGTLGMLVKWIDTSNITNAFVSDMKEVLNFYGNEYNWIIVFWTIGYIVGQLPSNIILTRMPAHIWTPFQEVGWTVFTFALAGAKSYCALLGLRFVVGLSEAGYWPALSYVLGSWYNKRALRVQVVDISSVLTHCDRRARETQQYPLVCSLDCTYLQRLPAGWYLQWT
jgi:ACS family pantothenate transporter-like MFS transporter